MCLCEDIFVVSVHICEYKGPFECICDRCAWVHVCANVYILCMYEYVCMYVVCMGVSMPECF